MRNFLTAAAMSAAVLVSGTSATSAATAIATAGATYAFDVSDKTSFACLSADFSCVLYSSSGLDDVYFNGVINVSGTVTLNEGVVGSAFLDDIFAWTMQIDLINADAGDTLVDSVSFGSASGGSLLMESARFDITPDGLAPAFFGPNFKSIWFTDAVSERAWLRIEPTNSFVMDAYISSDDSAAQVFKTEADGTVVLKPTSATVVPVPASLPLLLSGAAAMALLARRRHG